MKAPPFWHTPTLFSTALLPLAYLYDAVATTRRNVIRTTTLPVPVICVGNITAGGAGKTPVALHIGALCKSKNIGAFFLSRGYGGKLPGPLLVDPDRHTAHEVGDEPLLLARLLPTVVAKDRLAGANFAIAQGAQAIVMDDGFQNPAIAKTFSLLVIDGGYGFGNRRLIPAGPLRETVESGMQRAQAAIVIDPVSATPVLPFGKPVLIAKTQPDDTARALRGKRIVAFSGIGRPEKFFAMLRTLGADLTKAVPFADHHPYSASDLNRLAAKAAKHGAILVTTPKDAVRLPAEFKPQVTIAGMSLTFENQLLLDILLEAALHGKA